MRCSGNIMRISICLFVLSPLYLVVFFETESYKEAEFGGWACDAGLVVRF